MNYTDLTLFAFGVGGVLIHNLIKISELKKKNKFTASSYFGMEWPSISVSVILVILSILGKHEIKQLEQAGSYLGLAFVGIGYMGQSVFVKLMGRAAKKFEDSKD